MSKIDELYSEAHEEVENDMIHITNARYITKLEDYVETLEGELAKLRNSADHTFETDVDTDTYIRTLEARVNELERVVDTLL